MMDFDGCIEDAGLLELNDCHDKFTWEREGIREKLD